MKVIDAVWEKRNLGVTCYELEMKPSDHIEEVTKTLDSLAERQYMVAKIPSSRYDLLQLYQGRGYSFVETAIDMEYDYKKLNYELPEIPKRIQKVCEKCTWALMDHDDLEQLSSEIKKNIFETDRIFTDPLFTHEQAANRYDLWIKDLYVHGHVPYKVMLDGETVAFFLNEEIESGVYHGTLSGVYSDFKDTGMGYICVYAVYMNAIAHKEKKCVFSVSGNNPDILKLHATFGATIKGLSYVLVKHTN